MANSIGVAIPTFRRPRQLERALRSVLAQTRQPDEIHVSDDADDHATRSMVGRLGAGHIRYSCDHGHVGMNENWTYCLRSSTCDVVAILEDDDFWLTSHLSRAEAGLDDGGALYHSPHVEAWDTGETLEEYKTVHSPWHDLGCVSKPSPEAVMLDALGGGTINSSTVALRREALKGVPDFDGRYLMGMDTVMWARIGLLGGVCYGPDPGAVYTYHGENVSSGLLATRTATVQARAARRMLLLETLEVRAHVVYKVISLLSEADAGVAASASIVLLHRSVPKEVRSAVWEAIRYRNDVLRASRHLALAQVAGPGIVGIADLVDEALRVLRSTSVAVGRG